MANKTTKVELKPLKPGSAQEFNPVFEVTDIEGHGKRNGDFVHATLTPRSGGAQEVGVITLRMPYVLVPGSVLANFATLCGQDPAKGFDPAKALTRRIRVSFASAQ